MIVYETGATFLESNEEVLPMRTDAFPYLCMSASMERFPENSIAWHWHDAFEVDYISEGTIRFSTVEDTMTLTAGTAVFFNSGVLHSLAGEGRVFAHFFYGEFITGGIGSELEKKYVFPVAGNADLPYFCLYPDREEDRGPLNLIRRATKLCGEEPFGYELTLRSCVGEFWLGLHRRFADRMKAAPKRRTADEDRMKKMLLYLRAHYEEKIRLEELAGAANVSTRECARCFRRTIGASPKQYLNRYRLEKAAQRLRASQTDITGISEDCGFFSCSYFSRCFQERFGCTPREYRKQGEGR